jgi:hypothetical protein
MRRQTRPFTVEFKKGPRGSNGGTAPKPLWHGHDLALLKEAEAEQAADAIKASALPANPTAIPRQGQILAASIVGSVAEAATAAPTLLRAPAPEVGPPLEPAIGESPVTAGRPIRLHGRAHEPLPRGQRWKRRLPKVLR